MASLALWTIFQAQDITPKGVGRKCAKITHLELREKETTFKLMEM